MPEQPLTDDEIIRIRRDFAAADAARNTLLNKVGDIILKYAPSVATYLAVAAGGAGAGWMMKPVTTPDQVPAVQQSKPSPIKAEPIKTENKIDPWRPN